ncbi:M48 family metallopeptidase [Parerythrobacter jejuensis]|uniref:DUF45 domain-containing protein n=1 Tax=Parerythrobacter jejuensis TaxID=795812 RepID=A0A845AX44_9SPHN|nr:SprT family zinc-dependent metalloprotease [Parerythrobacter jejuensis]MXP31369.1 DUF45 domain-containing protein [Parerythrobacter jejuensis]MXP34129.1 DUF45 domain-containing protein [Parerythrobacter jejuensis]
MIDWLRNDPRDQVVAIGAQRLPVEIRRHPTAKRMVLRLADDGASVRVTIPRWGRTADALTFAQSRADWLGEQIAKRPDRRDPEPGGHLPLHGTPVRIDWDRAHPRAPELSGETIALGGPRETLAPRLRSWLQSEARDILAGDLAHYSVRAGLEVPKLALSSARRRWGSCSTSGAVRINWRLIMAPENVRRSVVAHETAHRLHFDHSPAFYAALEQIFDGDLPAADRWLKTEGKTLFVPFG